MKKILIYIIAFTLFVTACNSEDAWDIVKTRGDRKVETRELQAFTGITVYNGINVVLEKSDKYGAELDGWSNLLPKVKMTVDGNGMLTIEDKNKFDYVRDLDNKTTIRLFYNGNIDAITFHGDGVVSSVDTLQSSSLTILSEDASGSIDLLLNSISIGIGTNNRNIGDIKLKGKSSNLHITNWGSAPISASDLCVDNCEVVHRGPGDFYFKVSNSLKAYLYSVGSIYYKGNPTLVVDRRGKGNIYPIR